MHASIRIIFTSLFALILAVGCDTKSSSTTTDSNENKKSASEIFGKTAIAAGAKVWKASNCAGCHMEDRGLIPTAPSFKKIRTELASNLSLEKYGKKIEAYKAATPHLYAKNKDAIEAVLAEKDDQKRMVLFLKSYIKNPIFDRESSGMTSPTMPDSDLDALIAFVVTEVEKGK